MAWLLAEKANNGAVTAKRDTMWAGASAIVIPHVVIVTAMSTLNSALMLRYCRNIHPTWVKFNSKDTKESER